MINTFKNSENYLSVAFKIKIACIIRKLKLERS